MAGYIGTGPTPQSTQTRRRIVALEGQTTFGTMGYAPNYLDVYLNGVHLDSSDYIAANGSDVVLITPAEANDVIEIVAFRTFEVAKTEVDKVHESFTATAGQTVFNIPLIENYDVEVYINGLLLEQYDYLRSIGTITLYEASDLNDEVTVIGYGRFEVGRNTPAMPFFNSEGLADPINSKIGGFTFFDESGTEHLIQGNA